MNHTITVLENELIRFRACDPADPVVQEICDELEQAIEILRGDARRDLQEFLGAIGGLSALVETYRVAPKLLGTIAANFRVDLHKLPRTAFPVTRLEW